MRFRTFTSLLIGGVLSIIGLAVIGAEPVQASPSLSSVLPVPVPTTTVGTIRQIRVDPSDGKTYVLGSATARLGVISADGTSFSSLDYSTPLATNSGTDMAVLNGRLYVATYGLSNVFYRYDVDGSTATFVASSTLVSGTASVSFGSDPALVHVSKNRTVYGFLTDLSASTSTASLASSATRLAYGGGNLFYLTSAGQVIRLESGGGETTIATGGPSSASVRGLAVSSDGAALYYASTSALSKLSVAEGTVLWSASISSLAGFDVSTTTGRITTINTSGTVSRYDPINSVTSVSTTASGTSVVLDWTSGVAGSDFSGVTIRRSSAGFPASATDGTAVTSSSMATSLTETGLAEGAYYYSFFNQTSDGYFSQAATTTVTVDLPPDAPALSASVTGSTITLAWSSPSGVSGYVLRRSTVGFPATHVSDTAVTTTAASITGLVQASMVDGRYYYSVFAFDEGGNYSSAGTASVSVDTVGPTAPTGFTATASGRDVTLAWTNPVDADFSTVILRRSTAAFPASTTDGDAVTSTAATRHVDAGLADGTYYYSLFASDATGNLSSVATSTVTVDADVTPPASGGSGGTGFVSVTPSAALAAPLAFFVAGDSGSGGGSAGSVTVSSPVAKLRLNADPATVRGYAASLDPSFKDASLYPLDPSGEVAFALPTTPGTYTVYLKYFSLTGQPSPSLVQTVTYAPVTSLAPVPAPTLAKAVATFVRTLRQGDRGQDVKALQAFLNARGFVVAKTGQGSPGQETTFFGAATANAVKRFQEAYKGPILKPYALEKGTGIFGARMREVLNAWKD